MRWRSFIWAFSHLKAQAAYPEPLARATIGSLFGLAPDGGCRATSVTRGAVGSYPTFSPLPCTQISDKFECKAVYFLWPYPGITAGRRYLPSCPLVFGLSSPFQFLKGATARPPPIFYFRKFYNLSRFLLTFLKFHIFKKSCKKYLLLQVVLDL